MKLKMWQVDAFADRVFSGNPAAVVPLLEWLPDATLQAIANENNLAETAFFVATDDDAFHLRWFTPTVEVPLCGHATMASAWVIFSELQPMLDIVRFRTLSGILTVGKGADGCHKMALPAGRVEPLVAPAEFGKALGASLGVGPPLELHFAPTGAGGTPAPLGLWTESQVRNMSSSAALGDVLAEAGSGALLATAKGNGTPYDFVSRFFAPGHGIAEDQVTGSMHATLTPFWAKRLGKNTLRAYQASRRGGQLQCTDDISHVILSGPCALYMRAEISI